MRFAIDAIFIDQKGKVVGLCSNVKPYKLSAIFPRAAGVLELPAGSIQKSKTQVEDQVIMEELHHE